MGPVEIIVLLAAILIVGSVLGRYIYRICKHLPTGECASCNKGKNIVRKFHHDYGKPRKK